MKFVEFLQTSWILNTPKSFWQIDSVDKAVRVATQLLMVMLAEKESESEDDEEI